MKQRIAAENTAAADLLPPESPDGSGIGVNHADAYIGPLNVELDGGPVITCKRRGLKITFTIGERTGEGLMRRLAHGPDPRTILRRALEEAATDADSEFSVEEGELFLEV